MKKKGFIRNLSVSLLMACLGLIMLFPIVITFTNSFMTQREIQGNYGLLGEMPVVSQGDPAVFVNLKLIPDWLSFEQYGSVLLETPTYLFMLWNSVAMVVAIIAGQTVVSAFAAYAFAKLRFKGRESWFRIYLMTMLMPFQVTLVPNYIIADKLGLMNKASAIILPGIFAVFGVFMLRQFMLAIPGALSEAAQIDGAGHYRIFYQIMLPLMKPGIAALIVLLFVDYWNMVEQPLIFLEDAFKQPLSLYLSRIHKDSQGIGFAASLIYMTPMILLFLYAESYFIEGVQMSGIKG